MAKDCVPEEYFCYAMIKIPKSPDYSDLADIVI